MYEPTLDALRRGDTAQALASAEQLVGEQPNDASAHRLHAAALRLDGQRDAAVAALDRAIGLAPEDAQLHLERAGALLDGRQLDAAQASLAQAIGLIPTPSPPTSSRPSWRCCTATSTKPNGWPAPPRASPPTTRAWPRWWACWRCAAAIPTVPWRC